MEPTLIECIEKALNDRAFARQTVARLEDELNKYRGQLQELRRQAEDTREWTEKFALALATAGALQSRLETERAWVDELQGIIKELVGV
jgi:chromosome segregation ATPase